MTNSGDHIHVETHVPIPNTTVKRMEPMIVPRGAKVGHCRFFYPFIARNEGIFYALVLMSVGPVPPEYLERFLQRIVLLHFNVNPRLSVAR